MSMRLRTAIVIGLAAGFAGCIDPADQRPGLRLSGGVIEEFPAGWSFTDEYREIAIEVSTPYLLPHPVTIW